MITLQNTEELLKFLVNNYDRPYIGKLMFQGDICESTGIGINPCARVLLSPKYSEFIFFVYKNYYRENIILSISKSGGSLDQIPSVILPNYVADELVFEITQDEKYMHTFLF